MLVTLVLLFDLLFNCIFRLWILLRRLLLAVLARFLLSTRVAASNFKFFTAAVISAYFLLAAATAYARVNRDDITFVSF